MTDWMIGFIISGIPLLVGEIINHFWNISAEISRKIVHILASFSSIALLIFLDLNQIALLAFIFIFLLVIIRRKKLIASLYKVKRQTFGELFFPIGVMVSALFANEASAYVICLLIIGLSDSAASIIGNKIKSKKYSIFKANKSIAGSASFLAVSLLILLFTTDKSPLFIVASSTVLTVVEGVSPYGSDNMTIPLSFFFILGVF